MPNKSQPRSLPPLPPPPRQGRDGFERELRFYDLAALSLGFLCFLWWWWIRLGVVVPDGLWRWVWCPPWARGACGAVLLVGFLYCCLARYILECTTRPPKGDPYQYVNEKEKGEGKGKGKKR